MGTAFEDGVTCWVIANLKSGRLLESNLMVTRREGCGEGIVTEFWMDMYTLLYLKWITNKEGPTALQRELCSMSRGSLAGRRLGGERILYMCG